VANSIVAAARTRDAIKAANKGELEDARSLLVEALTADRDYAPAWLWFAAVTDDPGEQLFCLAEAQRTDPEHSTALAIQRLRGVEPQTPDELTQFTDPEPPKLVRGFREDARAQRKKRRLIAWGIVAAVVALSLAGFAYLTADRRTPVFIAMVSGAPNKAGPGSSEETQAAALWAVNSFNLSNRLPGKRIEIVTFDDGYDPTRAVEIAKQIVEDGRFVAVIGNSTSSASEAAGPIYQAAGIPSVTPSATADSVTAENPFYFRTVFNNSTEGQGLADYGLTVLGGGTSGVISSSNSFGTTLAEGFRNAWKEKGTIAGEAVVRVEESGEPAADEIDNAIELIVQSNPTGPIFVGANTTLSQAVIRGLHARGLTNPILASDSMSSVSAYEGLTKTGSGLDPKQLDSVFAASPLTLQGLTGEAVTFYDQFSESLGYNASWEAGLTHDAVDVISEALGRSQDAGIGGGVDEQRIGIRDQLAQAVDPATAFAALTHPIYFDSNRSAVRPVGIQVAEVNGAGVINLDASYYQLVEYAPEGGLTLESALESGVAVQVSDRIYTVQRVVNVGLNYNELTQLDTENSTFEADFFIYFKYPGNDRAVDIVFPNALDPTLGLGDPVRKTTVDGETYALYRVTGSFKSLLQFRDFPFDKQDLVVAVGNASLSAARIAYAPDPDLLATPQADRLISGVDAESTIDSITNWKSNSVTFYPRSVGNTASLGDPRAIGGPTGVTYSQFASTVEISRDVRAFLVKNVAPLFLLVLVTFISLWLPFNEGARVTFGVTGILTGSVMLNSVTSSLAGVDYSVAIEWAYYAFITLSGIMLLFTMIGRHYQEKRRLASLRKVNSFTKIFYGVFVFCTIMAYVIAFS
jgi:ABC-type branched-subunit amino acid transport system substrate-binding protein